MAQVLTNGAKEFLREPVIGQIVTVDAKGRPQMTPVRTDVNPCGS